MMCLFIGIRSLRRHKELCVLYCPSLDCKSLCMGKVSED